MALELIRNERTKLLAGALNNIATACVTVGILTPVAAAIYNLGGFGEAVRVWTLAIGGAFWLSAAVVLHMYARHVLGGLRP